MLISYWFLQYILLCRILANRRKTTSEHAQREYKNALKTHQPELRKMRKFCENRRKNNEQTKMLSDTKFIDFHRFWRSPGEPKSTKNKKKRMQKIMRFSARKKMRKKNATRGQGAPLEGCLAECARPAERFGGVQYTAKVCRNLEIMRGVLRRSLCRVYYFIQHARGVRRIILVPRIPPSPSWILSCTGALRHVWIGITTRGWKPSRKFEQILKKNMRNHI